MGKANKTLAKWRRTREGMKDHIGRLERKNKSLAVTSREQELQISFLEKEVESLSTTDKDKEEGT